MQSVTPPPATKLRSYGDYLAVLTRAGGYCTDPIGKCLREKFAVGGIPMKDIQLCLRDSDTYRACLRGERLGNRFNAANAHRAWLIWIEQFRPLTLMHPHEVAIDWDSGVFHQVGTSCFGCISDVLSCVYDSPKRERLILPPAAARESICASDPEADIAALQSVLATEEPSTREALIQARRGQGNFREQLLFVWNGKCAVTKCATVSLLRASHIKPWKLCENTIERLLQYNGLLLTPNLDAAFDRGLVGFDDSGKILISPKLLPEEAQLLGIHRGLRLVCVYDENKPFLQFHRQLHGFILPQLQK